MSRYKRYKAHNSIHIKHKYSLQNYNYSRFMALWILSGTNWVSRYEKGETKTNLDFPEQGTLSGSGISLAIYKSAPHPRQITRPAPNYSSFYWPDALPATQQRASKHCRQNAVYRNNFELFKMKYLTRYPVADWKSCQTSILRSSPGTCALRSSHWTDIDK